MRYANVNLEQQLDKEKRREGNFTRLIEKNTIIEIGSYNMFLLESSNYNKRVKQP